ncbi:MAG: hypothetical protein ACOYMA_04470 [Bacteroidia bacterium]
MIHRILGFSGLLIKASSVASVGLTILPIAIGRAVLLALWEGRFLLSRFFAYFFINGKSMKKKGELLINNKNLNIEKMSKSKF